MNGFNLLKSQLAMITQNSLASSLKTHIFYSLQKNFKMLNQSQVTYISSFSFLLKDRNIGEEVKNKKKEEKESVPSSEKESQSNKENKIKKSKTKTLNLTTGISDYDLLVKFKQVQKFVDKGLYVSLKVDNSKNLVDGMEKLFDRVQNFLTMSKIPAKLTQTGPIFNIIPVDPDAKKNQTKSSSSDSSTESKKES